MAVLSDYLVTDELTIVLALVAITVWLLHSIYKPLPLAHPILLGRQSDVARVRHPGESAVYRNYGTGVMGRVSVSLGLTPDFHSTKIPSCSSHCGLTRTSNLCRTSSRMSTSHGCSGQLVYSFRFLFTPKSLINVYLRRSRILN